MKVRELIKKLSKRDPEAEVLRKCDKDDAFECRVEEVEHGVAVTSGFFVKRFASVEQATAEASRCREQYPNDDISSGEVVVLR